MNISDFLSGKRVLAEVESPVNGKLTVVRDLAWGTYVVGGGLTQSGGILEKIWKTTLRKLSRITNHKSQITNVLILGLGGGSVAKLVRKKFPDAKITGVDLDPVIVELGRKYLKLDEYGVKVVIDDASEFLKKISTRNPQPATRNPKYDLICIDLYVGEEFPKKFESEKFIKNVKNLLSEDGFAIFNRTHYDDKRAKAVKFGNKLERIFNKVEWVYPEANVMFVCSR